MYPASFAQRRLWFLDQLFPGNLAYNIGLGYRLRGRIDEAALAAAIRQVIERHEVLRTRFTVQDGETYQIVDPPGQRPLDVVDLRAEPDPVASARRLANTVASTTFDLAAGPLFRAVLARVGKADRVLLIAVHHTVFDGWSIAVLERELGVGYAAFTGGEARTPLPQPGRYRDVAARQRAWLAGQDAERQREYWRAQLGDLAAVSEIPTCRPRPATPAKRSSSVEFAIPVATGSALIRLARTLRTTPFVVLMAGYQALQARYAGSNDVVVGTPLVGRSDAELENMIGFFANTQVIRTELTGDPSFADLVERVREDVLDAFEHQDYPFERIVDELSPTRHSGQRVLFQSWFDLSVARPPMRLGPVVATPWHVRTDQAATELALHLVQQRDGQISGRLAYATDLFERDVMTRLTEHYLRLLAEVAADPHRPVCRVPILGQVEHDQLVGRGADDPAPEPPHDSIATWFEWQAARTPDALAVVAVDQRLSYAELNSRANRLAVFLRRHGVGAGTVVGLRVPRDAEMVVAVLAVLKAGGTLLPISDGDPPSKIDYMLRNSRAAVLVTGKPWSGTSVRVIALNECAEQVNACPAENMPQSATADDLFYIIYTSGSTGSPKGVAMPQRPLLNLLAWHLRWSQTPGPLWQFAELTFDPSYKELFGALLAGETVVIVSDEQRTDPELLLDLLSRERVARLPFCPPLVLEQLALAARNTDELPPIREIVTGGDRLHLGPAIRELLRRLPSVTLANGYGPTETHLVSAHRYTTDIDRWPDDPPIGTPVSHVRIYLLDRNLEPVPRGAQGEMYVAGRCVSWGYFGRPDLTAERFLPDSFGPDPGARMYRTGDLARQSADGQLEFLGRADRQVKVRGHRVEPTEIETALRTHPLVSDAAVLPTEHEGEVRLTAYVVPAARTVKPRPAELRSHLRLMLPAPLVPARFVTLAQLPATGRGKVDRSLLPTTIDDQVVADPPRTSEERIVARVWADLLGVDEVGASDDFFDLGGHSVLATRVVARLRAELDCDLPLRTLFERPTVRELAAAVADGRHTSPPATPALDPGQRPPLSCAQRRLWFLDQLAPGSGAYNLPSAYELTGPLDVAALARSLGFVLDRHEALRTRFEAVDGEPYQVVLSADKFTLPCQDLRTEPAPLASARRLSAELAATRFDLSTGPLFLAILLRVDDDRHILALSAHHTVFDGLSRRILEREVSAAYAAYSRGAEPEAAPLPVRYSEFAAWQQDWLGGKGFRHRLADVLDKLADAPELIELPTDRPRPPTPSMAGDGIDFELPDELTHRLKELARECVTTLFVVTLAAYQVLLARYAATSDVVVGTPIAGRAHPDLDALIGCFVNTVAIRSELDDHLPFEGVVRRVRASVLDAIEHQDVPFERVVEELVSDRDLSRNPVFQVWFDCQDDTSPHELTLSGLRTRLLPRTAQRVRFDLELHLRVLDGRISGRLLYAADLFDRSTIQRFLRHYCNLIGAAVTRPTTPAMALPLFTKAERWQLVAQGNSDPVNKCELATIPAWFAAQVNATPDAIAVADSAVELSYAELDTRAERLAARIRTAGGGPEQVVAVCLPRGIDAVVAMLAVTKAGAGYLPVDPELPAARIKAMLADSSAIMVLTHFSLADWMPGTALAVDCDESADPGQLAPADELTPDNLCYVIFTSGSTGRPKGVAVSHRSVANLVRWHIDRYRLGPGDRVSQVAALSFDAAGWEIWPALLSGARLHIPPESTVRDATALAEHYRDVGTTVTFAPTPVAERLLREPLGRATRLRALLTGGDLFRPSPEEDPCVPVVDHYGPTENSVVATATGELAAPWADRSIGRPISGVRAYVLDQRLEPVPVGTIGELFVSGVGVARGYVADPIRTAERFLPDPFAVVPGERMYATGDLVRWRPDGDLEFAGRADDQLSVHGHRIEPGEIETALLGHPSIARAVAAVVRSQAGARTLVGYVVLQPDMPEPSSGELRDYLGAHLPRYMIPTAFITMDKIPLTRHGKVDHGRLPAPRAGDAKPVEPRNDQEEVIARIWAEVLQVPKVGVLDDFFALGGHSLTATRVVARLDAAFGVRLPLRTIFEYRTVAELSAEVERKLLREILAMSPQQIASELSQWTQD